MFYIDNSYNSGILNIKVFKNLFTNLIIYFLILTCSTRDMKYNEADGTVRMYLRGRPVVLYVPTPSIESYDLHKVNTPPQSKLKLDWVYGYRGRDCRSNLHFLPTGEMVYFVAAVVVLYNMEEHCQRHYLGHTDDVKW